MKRALRRVDTPLVHGLVILVLFFAFSASDLSIAQSELPPGDRPPMTVIDRVKEAGTVDDYDTDHIIVLDKSINHFRKLGVTYVETHHIYKVLTDKGCNNFSVLNWGFDPQSQFIEVKEVNIIRGEKVIPVDVGEVKEFPAPQRSIYWNDRIKLLQLPRLQVNDGIEVKTDRRGFTYALLADDGGMGISSSGTDVPDDSIFIPPMEDEYFDIVLFAGHIPILEKKYVLTLPNHKKLHSEIYNGGLFAKTTYTSDSTIYSWWAKDVPAWPGETRTPDLSDMVPKVVMATVKSWQTKSQWFFEVNDVKNHQFAFTPAIKEKVDQILKQAKATKASEEERARILLHWVAQNIRYSGQTMGKGEGFTIHSGEMIFQQRSGVCKDIAGMLITMMRANGMDSYPAMTMAGSRIELVPADQFNHCVTALRKADGSFEMYDPTWVPYNNDIWSKLETEQYYVVGTPEGDTLSMIPYSPPEESPLEISHDAKILEDGTLKGSFTLKGKGALDSRLRRFITGHRYPELDSYIAEVLHPISDRIENVTFSHHVADNFDGNMWWKFDYSVPEYATMVDGGWEFKSPMMQITKNHALLFRAGSVEWDKERKGDVFLYYTQHLDGTETIKLPKGYSVVDAPQGTAIDETFASFDAKTEMNKKKFVLKQDVVVKRRQIPPSGYEGFKKAMDEKKKYADTVYRAVKGGAK